MPDMAESTLALLPLPHLYTTTTAYSLTSFGKHAPLHSWTNCGHDLVCTEMDLELNPDLMQA